MGYVLVKPSPSFLEALKELSVVLGAPKNVKSISEKTEDTVLLTSSDIKWCHSKIKERGMPYRIHSLLNSSEIILPSYVPPPRNPELEARIKRLKAEQANRDYHEMTKNVYLNQYEAASFQGVGKELREMNRQLVNGLQYLLSIVGTFFAIFVALGFGNVDYGTRVLLAIFCAIAVAIAEVYFIIKQDMIEEDNMNKKLKEAHECGLDSIDKKVK